MQSAQPGSALRVGKSIPGRQHELGGRISVSIGMVSVFFSGCGIDRSIIGLRAVSSAARPASGVT